MENENKGPLYKVRSYSACLKDGFDLFTGNFKKIFKYFWPLALLYAIISTIFVTIYRDFDNSLQTKSLTTPEIIYFVVSLLIILLVSCCICGFTYNLFNKYKEDGSISSLSLKGDKKSLVYFCVRAIKLYLWLILFSLIYAIVLALIFVAISSMTARINMTVYLITTFALLFITILLYFVPFIYLSNKYMLEKGSRFFNLFLTKFNVGLRHWGSLFIVAFITLIIVGIIQCIICLPEIIIMITNRLSASAILDGDSSGLPSSYGTLAIIITIICTFLGGIISIVSYFPSFFNYGSIEAEEKEKQKYIEEEEKQNETI